MTQVKLKVPNEIVDYSIDWTDFLASTAETIASTDSSWTASSTALQVLTTGSHASSSTSGITRVFLAGGLAGQLYEVRNTILTNQLRTGKRRLLVRCEVR